MKTSQRKRNFVKNTRKSKTQKKFIGAKKRKKDNAPRGFRKISTENDTYYYNSVMAGTKYSLKIISKNSEKCWSFTKKEVSDVTNGLLEIDCYIISPYFVRCVIEKLIIKDGKAERKAQNPKFGSLYIYNGNYGTVRIRRINGKQTRINGKQIQKQNKNYNISDFDEPNWSLCYLNKKFLYNETAFSVMQLNPGSIKGDAYYHVKKPFMVLEKCDISENGNILPNSFTAMYNVYKILTFENRIRYICFPLYTNFTNIFTFLS